MLYWFIQKWNCFKWNTKVIIIQVGLTIQVCARQGLFNKIYNAFVFNFYKISESLLFPKDRIIGGC